MRRITNVAYHRNGVGGEPFYIVKFKDGRRSMVGFVFDTPGHVAVFDADLLAQGLIAYSENSWRGDEYAKSESWKGAVGGTLILVAVVLFWIFVLVPLMETP